MRIKIVLREHTVTHPCTHVHAVRCWIVALLLARSSARCARRSVLAGEKTNFVGASVAPHRAATRRNATSYIFITGLPDAVFAMRPQPPDSAFSGTGPTAGEVGEGRVFWCHRTIAVTYSAGVLSQTIRRLNMLQRFVSARIRTSVCSSYICTRQSVQPFLHLLSPPVVRVNSLCNYLHSKLEWIVCALRRRIV